MTSTELMRVTNWKLSRWEEVFRTSHRSKGLDSVGVRNPLTIVVLRVSDIWRRPSIESEEALVVLRMGYWP